MRIGMIGLDTSHVPAFTEMLNDPASPHHVPGGKVVVAFPGGSDDFELSRSRVAGYTAELRDKWQVRIVDSAEAVAEGCDVVFIESVDGRAHRPLFDKVARFGKPIFVDKPFAVSVADAKHMLDEAARLRIPLMSSSALRYCDVFADAMKDRAEITACDIFGPMAEEPTQPGLFWYGIHTVEMLVSAMGVGCAEVAAMPRSADHDFIRFTWKDGRVASLRGLRNAHTLFGMTVHRRGGVTMAHSGQSGKPFYASLVEAIMRSLPAGRSDVPAEEMLEAIRIIEAANESRRTGHVVRFG